jgi:outer membrane protein OmpA-like peptidoglycan-associated protein
MYHFSASRSAFSCIWLIFALIPILSQGQNIVYNPGFEQISNCPEKRQQITRASFWFGQDLVPDLHALCAGTQTMRPDTAAPLPYQGIACAGLLSKLSPCESGTNCWKSARLIGQVRQILKPGQSHCIKLNWMKKAGESPSTPGIKIEFYTDLHLAQTGVDASGQTVLLPAKGDFDRNIWSLAQGNYIATGAELYFVVQILEPAEAENSFGQQSMYYYLDNLCIVPVDANWTCDCGSFERFETIIIEKNYGLNIPKDSTEETVLEHVEFEFDKAVLLPKALPELDKLVKLLQHKPALQIEVIGHTDNQGSSEYNLNLSKLRAAAVIDYLTSKGIDKQRLTATGKGDTEPLQANDTEAGRQVNRRVSFKLK